MKSNTVEMEQTHEKIDDNADAASTTSTKSKKQGTNSAEKTISLNLAVIA
jgi:hypothetical protein